LNAVTNAAIAAVQADPLDPDQPTPCAACATAIQSVVVGTSLDADGRLLPKDQAIRRVVNVLKQARQAPATISRPAEPLGAVITAEVELSGLKEVPVMLSWSMWASHDEQRLYGDWLNKHVAYRLSATTEHDTASVNIWVPLPKEKGPYFVEINLIGPVSAMATVRSPEFS
jgi:hypothetical protein